jgi:hypothetical protein
MRVAYVWNHAVQAEETLQKPRAVQLGPERPDTFSERLANLHDRIPVLHYMVAALAVGLSVAAIVGAILELPVFLFLVAVLPAGLVTGALAVLGVWILLRMWHGAHRPGPTRIAQLSDTVEADGVVTLLAPSGAGYALQLRPFMGGELWIGGARRRVQDLMAQGSEVKLGPDDYGVVTIGAGAVFFQQVRNATRAPANDGVDSGVIAAFCLSAFLFLSMAVFVLLISRALPSGHGLDLPPDLVAEFMVTPPPEDLDEQLRQDSGTETEDPGLRSRDETGGRRHEGDEGRVGREDARQEDTEIAGEQRTEVATKVRQMGLLGALSGGAEENVIADALDIPDVGEILGGTGSARTILGRGSGGAGLRGTGTGGGGDGTGSLFGAGDIGRGIGAGRGGGLGRGQGGIGVKGRTREERTISVQRGTPQVSGYLSAEQINRVVRANQAAIRYCYEVEVQRQPNLRGRVSIQWRINLQGSVTSARVASSTLNNANVEGCMVRQIRRWRFPQPDGGEVVVSYPFIFGVQGG